MQLDYYCFPTSTGNLSDYENPDQHIIRIEREYYKRCQIEVKAAEEKNKLLLFDQRNQTFISENGEEVDIAGKVIFPRGMAQQEKALLKSIERAKGKPLITQKESETIQKWFYKVRTKRDFKLTTFRELDENLSAYKQEYGETVFVKTVREGYSEITWLMDVECEGEKIKILLDSSFRRVSSRIRDFEREILIYKTIKPLKDRFGNRKWRAFVIDNQLYSLSRASDKMVLVENYIYEEAEKMIQEFKGIMPSCYTVDFFEYKEDGKSDTIFDVYEFKSIVSSTAFENNNLVT